MQTSTQRESKGEKLPILYSFLKKITVLPIAFICAFTLPSLATECAECDNSDCCSGCKGYYWTRLMASEMCVECNLAGNANSGEKSYCPGNNERYGCAQNTLPNYRFAAATAKSINECYMSLDDSTLTGHGPKCHTAGDDIGCRAYYRSNGVPYISCGDNPDPGTDSNGEPNATSDYHMEGTECYKNSLPCKHTHILNSDDWGGAAAWENDQWNMQGCNRSVTCRSGDGSIPQEVSRVLFPYCSDMIVEYAPNSITSCPAFADTDYHMEGDSCYGTSMTCSSFGGGNDVGVSGVASYSSTGWNVSDCQKTTAYPNDDPCMGSETSTPTSNTVTYVGDGISWGEAVRTCVGCIAGKIPEDSSFSGCVDVALGYYSEGCRNARAATLPLCVNDDNFYQGVPCPAGMTTDRTGAINGDSCHYTTSTKFCGNNGCFTLDDVSGGQSYNEYTWNGGTTAAN